MISWCNWAISDKHNPWGSPATTEANGALYRGANTQGHWTADELTDSGKLVRKILREAKGLNGDDFPN